MLGAAGCGGAHSGSVGGGSEALATTKDNFTPLTTKAIPPGQSLRGDGDVDNPGDIDGNGDQDGNKDADSDNPTPNSYKLPDKDDTIVFRYGHRPGAAVERAIASTVKRYYAAASTGDGAAGCSLLVPKIVSGVIEGEGKGARPSYLEGFKGCAAILSALFRHSREELTEPITVVDVRVNGNMAEVVLSSRKMPASETSLLREAGSWRVFRPLGQPLP
jgi:hypothetical protein